MSVIVDIGGTLARIDGYSWSSKSRQLQDLLNSMLDPFGPPTSDPSPDLTVAEQVAQLLGGRIASVHSKSIRKPGVIY